ncbi:MAG TPA: NAD(P)/FAD-dependent oxidoreductase [Actinomycetota bacterium]|jgi:phytoene dehydrogenase-like protein|nr:NAD(P)/FAD-dependent oxidoreductase [Actinomycetota bacterium]
MSYDAVIIGAGHNGLVCAAYLGRAGLKVLVVERTDRIGGACVTEELFPGFRISTASYALSLLLPEIMSELELGLDIRPKDPEAFAPSEDGGGLLMWRDPARRHEAISAISPHDADAYPRFEELFEEASRRFRPLLAYPATRRQVRRAFRRSEVEDLFDKTVDGSIASLCEEYFESELIQGMRASQGIIGSAAGPRTPGTAYLYLHHAFGLATGEAGVWGLVRGGMGAITRALAERVRAAGGEIRLEAEVDHLKLKDRSVGGVVLKSGEEIDAPVVCSNADPKRTAALVADGALPPEFVEDVRLLPTAGTVVKVNCALGDLPRFTGMERFDGPGPEHKATITVAPSIDYLEEACRSAAEGRPAERMFCEAWIQSATESGLAPEGKHTLSIFAQYAPYELAEGSWDSRREEIGDLVLAAIERYAPGLTDLVEDRLVLGPPDLEARFGLTGGNIFHGELLPDWLFDKRPASTWHRHRLPVSGFYLCGSGAHPGGGVCGAPGRNAARAVLEDAVAVGASERASV